MESITYHVHAHWDSEANVWVAMSDDVPGLATESETIEELTAKLRTMIPELLEINGLLPENVPSDSLTFELTSHRQELVTLAS
jgi:predicted RNase H-like HicB family nuclease